MSYLLRACDPVPHLVCGYTLLFRQPSQGLHDNWGHAADGDPMPPRCPRLPCHEFETRRNRTNDEMGVPIKLKTAVAGPIVSQNGTPRCEPAGSGRKPVRLRLLIRHPQDFLLTSCLVACPRQRQRTCLGPLPWAGHFVDSSCIFAIRSAARPNCNRMRPRLQERWLLRKLRILCMGVSFSLMRI